MANVAERSPLLIAVDDAHWSDPASLRWVVHLLRRIEAVGVLVLVAVWPAESKAERALLDEVSRRKTVIGDAVKREQYPTAMRAPRAASRRRAKTRPRRCPH